MSCSSSGAHGSGQDTPKGTSAPLVESASLDTPSVEEIRRVQALASRARANVERVVVGKSDLIDLVLVALLCEGHVLLEDVPGVGKTLLAKAIARTLGCGFR